MVIQKATIFSILPEVASLGRAKQRMEGENSGSLWAILQSFLGFHYIPVSVMVKCSSSGMACRMYSEMAAG
jgi:hypothetical protein